MVVSITRKYQRPSEGKVADAVLLNTDNMSKAAQWAGGSVQYISQRSGGGSRAREPFWAIRLLETSASGLVYAKGGEWLVRYDGEEKIWVYTDEAFRTFFQKM